VNNYLLQIIQSFRMHFNNTFQSTGLNVQQSGMHTLACKQAQNRKKEAHGRMSEGDELNENAHSLTDSRWR